MSSFIARAPQHIEPWANGAGTTTVVLREPDTDAWRVRISVAKVESAGPFSDLPATRRVLVPLDAPMTLRHADGSEQAARRFGVLRFAGSPPPVGLLPEGPTRDFNLMLRGGASGDAFARPLVDSMVLLPEPGTAWLVYLHAGHARVGGARPDAHALQLDPGDAAHITLAASGGRIIIEGAGELVLVKFSA